MPTLFTTQQSSASTAIIRSLVKGAIAFACLQATIVYLQMIGLASSTLLINRLASQMGDPRVTHLSFLYIGLLRGSKRKRAVS